MRLEAAPTQEPSEERKAHNEEEPRGPNRGRRTVRSPEVTERARRLHESLGPRDSVQPLLQVAGQLGVGNQRHQPLVKKDLGV